MILRVLIFLIAFCTPGFAAPWWDANYKNRAEIVVINNTASAANEMPVVAMLQPYNIQATDRQADGDDVRVVYWNGASNAEIDRRYSYESVVFKLQAAISANSRTSDSYWLYWNNPSATNPPSGLINIFSTAYTFDTSLGADWVASCMESGESVSVNSGVVDVAVSAASGVGCLVSSNVAITTDARRMHLRFKTGAASSKIKFGFGWDAGYQVGTYRGTIIDYTNSFQYRNTSFSGANNRIAVRFKSYTNGPTGIKVYYTEGGSCFGYSETCAQSFPSTIIADGSWQTVTFDITDVEWGAGDTISGLRLDYLGQTANGMFEIDWIELSQAGASPFILDQFSNSESYTENNITAKVGFPNIANVAEIGDVGTNAITLRYANSNSLSTTSNTEQAANTNWAASEWYTVIYEMLDHSIVGRIYRESTGALVESFTWGRATYTEMNGTNNQWLSTNTYPFIIVESTGNATIVSFDDIALGIRKMPDVMPLYFKECGYKHQFFHEASDGVLYSTTIGSPKLYKSTDKCASAQLVKDFTNTAEFTTDLYNFSAEGTGMYPYMATAYSVNLATASLVSTPVSHRYQALKVTASASAGADRFYDLAPWGGGLYGYTSGQTYTVSADVYVPSGQGIDLTKIYIRYTDYDGATYYTMDSDKPTATDVWQRLSVTFTTRTGVTNLVTRLYLNQDAPNAYVYWDKLQRDGGSTGKPEVFWDNNHAPTEAMLHGIYKRNGRLFVCLYYGLLMYSDDEGATWNESQFPFSDFTYSEVNNWGFTSTTNYLFAGQYGFGSTKDKVFRSADNGATFIETKWFNTGTLHIHMLKVNPYNGIMYASNGDGSKKVYYTLDPEAATPTWTEIANATPANLGLAFKDARAILGADFMQGNKIKATDDNSTWTVQAVQGGNFDLQTWDMAYHAASGVIFALGEMDPGYGVNRIPSVLCSFDNGESWQIFYEAIKGATNFFNSPHSLTYPSASSKRIYFGVSSYAPNLTQSFYYEPPSSGAAQGVNPGVDHGINPNIYSLLF